MFQEGESNLLLSTKTISNYNQDTKSRCEVWTIIIYCSKLYNASIKVNNLLYIH